MKFAFIVTGSYSDNVECHRTTKQSTDLKQTHFCFLITNVYCKNSSTKNSQNFEVLKSHCHANPCETEGTTAATIE